jgi:ATP-binding cassette subfamily C protein CydC
VIRLLRLLSLYRPVYGWMALGILLSLATVLANITLMAVSGWFITAMALAGAAQASMNYFTPAAIIRGAAIVRTAGRYFERLVTHEATLQLLARLRVWFYQRLEPLAPAALQAHHSGDLLSRIRADIDTLDNLYLRLLVPGVTALLAIMILSLFLATYDQGLAGVLLSLLITGGFLVPIVVLKLGNRPGQRKVALLAQQRSMLVDSTQGLGELLLYGAAQTHLQRVDDNSRALAAEQATLAGISGLSQAALLFLANLAMWSTLWMAIPMVEWGVLARADLAMLALLSLAAFEAVAPMPGALQAYGETLAAARRLFEIVDLEVPVRPPREPTTGTAPLDIRFEHVSFGYPGAARNAIEELDLCLPFGEHRVLLGPSGSGKSSIVQLLLRFYAPQQGRIKMGGITLEDWDTEQLRNQLAVVPQQTHLFTGTIRDNLLIARPDADDRSIQRACAIAQIQAFIDTLPDGYDTWVGEAGATISGGEARRLAIARALLKDSPVLVLDEPTEGLDATTAAHLLDAIRHATMGKTVLLITHHASYGAGFGTATFLSAGRVADPVR